MRRSVSEPDSANSYCSWDGEPLSDDFFASCLKGDDSRRACNRAANTPDNKDELNRPSIRLSSTQCKAKAYELCELLDTTECDKRRC